MALSVLSFGDGTNGSLLSAWTGEFAYAMGERCNFDKIASGKPEQIVLALVCVPTEWPLPERTSRKGRGDDRELWSSARVNYARFAKREAHEKIEAIAGALKVAIGQVPPRKLDPGDLESFISAVDFAANDLRMRPDRHPR